MSGHQSLFLIPSFFTERMPVAGEAQKVKCVFIQGEQIVFEC